MVNEIAHAIFSLELGGLQAVARLVGPAELDAWDQVSQHGLFDAGLAEGRQNAFDVTEEHAVRPNDQHTLIFERESVRVQQIRRTVQRHHGLASARATLYDEHAMLR